MQNKIIIFLSAILFVSCISIQEEKNAKNKQSKTHITLNSDKIMQSEVSGIEMTMLFSHIKNYQGIKLNVKKIHNFTTFIFPTNSIISGIQISLTPTTLFLWNLTNALYAKIKGRRISEFIGIRYIKENFEIIPLKYNKLKNTYSFNIYIYDKIKTSHPRISRLLLECAFYGKKKNSLILEFMMMPLGGRIPDIITKIKGYPIYWKWTWYEHGKVGSTFWHILNYKEKIFTKQDFDPASSKNKKISPNKFFKFYSFSLTSLKTSSLALKSIGHLGFVYENNNLITFLPPYEKIYLKSNKNNDLSWIRVYPLFGGTSLMNEYLKSPITWKIK